MANLTKMTVNGVEVQVRSDAVEKLVNSGFGAKADKKKPGRPKGSEVTKNPEDPKEQ